LRSKLPPELIDRIIEDASYWPHSSVYFERPFTVPFGHVRDGRSIEDAMYMRTLPLGIRGTEGDLRLLPKDFGHDGAACTAVLELGGPDDHSWSAPTLLHPCRKIEFQLWSHDQGWGGESEHRGTYNESYTWFDVGIEKFHTSSFANNIVQWPPYLLFREDLDGEPFHIQRDITTPVIPSDTTLQKNVVAERVTTEHTIVWHFLDSFDKESVEAEEACKVGRGSATVDGKFVRSMQVGDCITLWARARFPGWENVIQKVKITVYWAV
jgi:hypothetical protein